MTDPTPARVQLALNVDDLDAAVRYYARLLGTEPAKQRPGYANFAVDRPPLKLVLIENAGAPERLNHLGIELGSVQDVDAEQSRLGRAGITSTDENGACCYAVQDKFWTEPAPDGERWEFYTVLADSPTFAGGADDVCCGTPVAAETSTGSACCT